MYRLEREDFVRSRFIYLWAVLGFQAGFINAFGFVACGRYVSHVTGFGTQIGVALADRDPYLAVELLGFPAAFIAGAFTSSFFTSARLERKRIPRYGLITFLLPLVIAFLWLSGHEGIFGSFGANIKGSGALAFLFIASFVCGMQNGCFATMTKGQIRTTHLTGISTDIGTDLARLWFGKLSVGERGLTIRTNFSRFATFIAFATGSVLSVELARDFGYNALAIPLFTAISVYFAVRRIHAMLDERLLARAIDPRSDASGTGGAPA